MENQIQKTKIDFSYYLGSWINSYDKARVIGAFRLYEENEQLMISINGSETGFYSGDWGSQPVKHYSYSPTTNDIVAFQARFEMEGMEAVLAMNENKGLLIIAGYFTFKDEDKRSSCFVREFFFKE